MIARIMSTQYHDEYGVPHAKRYYVQWRKKFLFFWERWVTEKHTEACMGDIYSSVTYFDTLEKAEEFIDKKLSSVAQKHVKKVEKSIETPSDAKTYKYNV